MHGNEAKADAFNSVARTCARGGMLDEGLSLLEQMQASSIDVGRATVCLALHLQEPDVYPSSMPSGEQCMQVMAAHLVRAVTRCSIHAVLFGFFYRLRVLLM